MVVTAIKGDTECVMSDVIKIRLKRKDERRRGKKTPKRDGFRNIVMTSHMTLFVSPENPYFKTLTSLFFFITIVFSNYIQK